MNTVIRDYRPSDRIELERCIVELQRHISRMDPLERHLDDQFDASAYVRHTLTEVRKFNGKIFLAERKGKIVGCVAGIIPLPSKVDVLERYPSKDGKILELIVSQSHRGAGVGLRLMKAMEKYFRSQKCKGISVECFAPNLPAHQFYKKAGYVDRLHLLLKLL